VPHVGFSEPTVPVHDALLKERVLSNSAAFQGFDLVTPQTDHLVLRQSDEFLLLREMHHRLANTLTVLTSVLWDEFAQYKSPEVRTSLARCEARIVAFANLHRNLVVGAAHDWISVQSYVEQLCEALTEALLKPLGVRCEVYARAVEFPSERYELLGLVIAELVTNAAKHAFHGRSGGLVKIALFKGHDDSWRCVVSDNGVGPVTASPGVGSKFSNS
jgi:two-component sensor histidine kinase